MSIDKPEALVEAFKSSGDFDRLQKDLLAEFQNDESYSTFKAEVGEIVRQRLAKAQMLHYLPQDMASRDLTQEVERYPVVDRAVKDMRTFSDPAFLSKIQNSLQRILQEDKQNREISVRQSEMGQIGQDHRDSQSATIRPATTDLPSKTRETGLKGTPSWAHPACDCPPEDAMDVD